MQQPPRPVPDQGPQPITMEQYHAYSAEKIELWGGYVFGPSDFHDYRRDMLLLLLVNEGLEEAVRLAPLDRWRAAIARVERQP